MSRSSLKLAVSLLGAALLPGCGASQPAPAAPAEQQADAEVAATIQTYAAMPRLADDAIAYLARRQNGAVGPKAVADQLRTSARTAFDPALLTAQLPLPAAANIAWRQALGRYRAAVAGLSALPKTEEAQQRDADAAQARLAARTDRDAIESLATVMPEPERVREQAITLRRMLQAFQAVHGGLPDDLRAADTTKLQTGVDQMLADTRRGGTDYGDALPPLNIQVGAAQGAVRRALIEMSPADVATLLAVQQSPSGRARGQLLKAALAAANDQAGRAMLLDFFTNVRRLSPDAFH